MVNKIDFIEELLGTSEIDNFWTKYHEFCKLINEIEFDIDRFILALPYIFKQIENDYSSNEIYLAVKNYSSKNLDRGNYLFDKLSKSEESNIISLIPSIIDGLSISAEDEILTIEKVKFLIQSNNTKLERVGLLSITSIQISNEKLKEGFIEYSSNQLERVLENKIEDNYDVVAKVYRNLRTIISNSNEQLIKLSQKNIPSVQMELVNLLWRDIKIEEEYDLFNLIISNLYKIDPKHKGICNNLNYLLSNISKSNPTIVINFLEKWLLCSDNRAKEIGIFKSVFVDLYRNNPDHFKKLITNWLNSDDLVFQRSLFEIFNDFKLNDIKELEVSKNVIGKLDIRDVKYVISKIVGFIYDKSLLESILYSILKFRVNDDKIVELIAAIFNDYLIFNYYSTIDFLYNKKKGASKEERKIINLIINKSTKYYDKMHNLPIINELKPSEERLNYFNKIQSKNFNKSYKENRDGEKSFLSMVKTINFRTGKSSFAKYQGKYTDKMTPSLISHSAEMPRGEFIDPIGQAKYRLISQNVKR